MIIKPYFRRRGPRGARVNDKMIVCDVARRLGMKKLKFSARLQAIRDTILLALRSIIPCLMHGFFGALIHEMIGRIEPETAHAAARSPTRWILFRLLACTLPPPF